MSGKRAHVWIEGRVQGVFFRDETRRQAVARKVTGWVRNLPDGRVEAVFEGEASAVDGMVRWCRQGSSMSRVEEVKCEEETFQGELERFEIRF